MRIIKFIDKLINFFLIMFFIIIILFSGYALYDVQEVYNDAELSDDILKYKPDIYKAQEVEKFDLADLQNNINEDICGWIRIDGTNIDYPILYSKNTTYYLNKDYKKNYSAGGSIFLNSKNDRLFGDDYTIIYGHNMVKNLMFSDINKYEDMNFFQENSGGILYTQNDVYNIKIYTYNVLNSSIDIAYKIDEYKDGKNTEIINNLENTAIYKNNIEVSPEDKFILLSTCHGVASPQRAVLFCKLEKNDTSTTINDNSGSDIERDKKNKEKEQFEEKRREESLNIKKELEVSEKSKKSESIEYKVKNYIDELLATPSKIILYILIGITIIIYIMLFYQKFKKKKGKNRSSRVFDSKTERINIKRILKILGLENKEAKRVQKTNTKRKKKSKGKHTLN